MSQINIRYGRTVAYKIGEDTVTLRKMYEYGFKKGINSYLIWIDLILFYLYRIDILYTTRIFIRFPFYFRIWYWLLEFFFKWIEMEREREGLCSILVLIVFLFIMFYLLEPLCSRYIFFFVLLVGEIEWNLQVPVA